jgi:hypothetical protein
LIEDGTLALILADFVFDAAADTETQSPHTRDLTSERRGVPSSSPWCIETRSDKLDRGRDLLGGPGLFPG